MLGARRTWDRFLTCPFHFSIGLSIYVVRPANKDPERLETCPTSLANLARRITSRTTDLVAISIVVVAALTLGRQVVHWWHAEPPAAAHVEPALPAPAWEDELQPLSLEFGDLPLALTRQVVIGDQKAAVEALVRHCQNALEAATCPTGESRDAEQRLLEKIADLTPIAAPVDEQVGNGQVYIVDERFTLVAAVKQFSGRTKETAREQRRVVCWGMAMPARERAWTLYVFQESPVIDTLSPGLPNVPLPLGAQRNMSVRDERGGAVIGFSGTGSAHAWMKFYDDWFSGQGWPQTDKWSIGADAWSASFSRLPASPAGRVEIRFAAEGNGQLTGILQTQ
jgi:hypothetical protein